MSKSANENDNSSNLMNHSGNSKVSKRKSLLKFLSKKSTKVEPDNNLYDDSNSSSNTAATPYDEFQLTAPSINNYHDKTVSVSNNVMPISCLVNHNRNNNGKYQSASSSPNSKNLPKPSPKSQNITFNLDKSKSLDHFKTTNALLSTKRITSSKDCRTRPMSLIDAHNSLNNDSLIMTQSDHSIEYQSSITMQHSRSRLRERLLPPGYKIEQSVTKCLSSPDIADNEQAEHRKEARSSSMESVNYASTAIHRLNSNGTNSLARQALMAADVLHLIPTEKARERSYLAGRLGSISLLGKWQLERVIPAKEVKIFVGTWNMNGGNPPRQMNDFVLPLGVEHVPDIVAIGTQESSSERFEWEVILQETLGPSHILLHSTSLGTLHLAVFIRRDLIWYCSVPEDDCLSVRPGSAFRTKGAVAISFCLFGTSLLFVTSHLTAHQQKVKERVQDIKRIIHALDLPRNLPIRKNKDVTQNFDSVYWCGDLNFRLSEPREKLMKWIENTKFPLPSHLPHGYMHTDQLSSVLSEGAAFKGFKEANITFPPTYKYDPGTQQFDTSSKQRAPAYTDRILYKYRRPLSALRRGSAALSNSHFPPSPVECIAYDSVPSIITSDHKPVWGLFKNFIQPGLDTIPLAAGLFNRDVYLEGMRRRLNNNDSGASAVCVIQ